MKKSVILDIFNGFRGHRETMNNMQKNKENAEISCSTYDELEQKLSPELFKLHQKLIDALELNWSDEVDFYFVQGFKLGLLIGIECMEE